MAEVLRVCPAAARVLLDHGMRCVGCPFSAFETVADVARVYGLDAPSLAVSLLDADPAVPHSGGLRS